MRAALALAALLAACPVQAGDWLSPRLQAHPLVGAIVDAQGRTVTREALMAAVGGAPVVLVGEKHDNPDHHRLEAELIAARLQAKPGSAVVFEMLDEAQAPHLPALAAGDDLDAIHRKLDWPAKGWDLAVYGPLFQATVADGKLVAGNIGKAMIGRLYAEGEALVAADPRFASVAKATPVVRERLLDTIFEAHCRMQARESLAPMLAIQLAKDASMAEALRRETPAMLIAGGEHARGDSGVASHGVGEGAVVVQLVEVREGQDDAADYREDVGPADYLWFTPATESKDYCAGVTGRAAG